MDEKELASQRIDDDKMEEVSGGDGIMNALNRMIPKIKVGDLVIYTYDGSVMEVTEIEQARVSMYAYGPKVLETFITAVDTTNPGRTVRATDKYFIK